MALEEPKKLQIFFEKKGPVAKNATVLFFEQNPTISAEFNPNKLVFNKTVNWKKQEAKDRDVPELQFTNAQARTLTVELLFDTYDTPDVDKKDVRKEYT